MEMKLVLYANTSYGGNYKDCSGSCDDLTKYLPNGAKSIMVKEDSEPCQVFTEVQFEGDSRCLYPGSYEDLTEIGLVNPVKSFRKAPIKLALQLFERNAYRGLKKTFTASCADLTGEFPDGVSSIIVNKHSQRWQVFTEVQFGGATVTLEPGGRYETVEQMQLGNPVKSFRKAPSEQAFLFL